MQRIEHAVKERLALRNIEEIKKAEHELLLLRREKENSEYDISLEQLFYTHSKAVMLGAKFYHECMMLKIPCVLEVTTHYGRVDSIIEVNKQYIIVEFKTLFHELSDKETRSQVERYHQHECPVILIQGSLSFSKLLVSLLSRKLLNKIYVYTLEKFKIY